MLSMPSQQRNERSTKLHTYYRRRYEYCRSDLRADQLGVRMEHSIIPWRQGATVLAAVPGEMLRYLLRYLLSDMPIHFSQVVSPS